MDDRKKIDKLFSQIDKIAKGGSDQVFEYYKLIDDVLNKGEYSFFEECLSRYYEIDIIDYKSIDDVKKKTWSNILFQTNSSFLTKLKKLYDKKQVYQTTFDFYSQDPNRLHLSLSDPLSSTYSIISTSQSISVTKADDIIYFNTTDSNIFKLDIFQTTWVDVNGTEVPSTKRTIDQMSVTQSSQRTQISTLQSSEYLLNVYSRPPLEITNYRLSLSSNGFLGQIKEIDVFNSEVKYLIKNVNFSKMMGAKETFLEVTRSGATSSILIGATSSTTLEQALLNRYSLAIDILLENIDVISDGYWNDFGYWNDDFIWID